MFMLLLLACDGESKPEAVETSRAVVEVSTERGNCDNGLVASVTIKVTGDEVRLTELGLNPKLGKVGVQLGNEHLDWVVTSEKESDLVLVPAREAQTVHVAPGTPVTLLLIAEEWENCKSVRRPVRWVGYWDGQGHHIR